MQRLFDDVEEDLYYPIGAFLINYSLIEEVISQFLIQHDEFTSSQTKLPKYFLDRLKLFKKMSLNCLADDNLRHEFVELISTVRKLYQVRNLIAHNSLSLIIERDVENIIRKGDFFLIGKDHMIKESIVSLYNRVEEVKKAKSKIISFAELLYKCV
jgi:hypothetical protein